MPTGYTADVGDGKVTEFPDFAMRCARAFGATITMRDDSPDATIPDEFEPSDYNARALVKARERLAELQAMDRDAIREAANAAYVEALSYYRKSVKDRADTRANYEAMLDKVLAWEPPTPDHAEMKAFMVQQLEESIRFDCGYEPEPPTRETPEEWHEEQVQRAERDIEYHAKGDREERERAAGRTEWVRALRASLMPAVS